MSNHSTKRVLLIAPDFFSSYTTKARILLQRTPPISLAVLGASLLSAGHLVDILDLNVSVDKKSDLNQYLGIKYDYIGITFLTPSFSDALQIAALAKKKQPHAVLICGGPHVSSLPEDTLRQTPFDIAVIGEGEKTIVEIVQEKALRQIQSICYKKGRKVFRNPRRPLLADLDESPLPAWHLYNLKKYNSPRILCRRNPVGSMETSRGCIYGCVYCNKSVFGRYFRAKSPERVVFEMKYMLRLGFGEILIADDGFSTNISRAKEICDLIVKKGLDFPWVLQGGLRADRIDLELFKKLKKAGCYRLAMGVETGDKEVLKAINKGETLSQIRKAFKLAKKAGIETYAFLMFGLPLETEKTMRKTIEFTKQLDPDYPKAAITVPLPKTPLFNTLQQSGAIRTYNWKEYNQQTTTEIYKHPNLEWRTIHKYYSQFYKELYYRPRYIWKRMSKDIGTGQIFWDIFYFIKGLKYKW